VVSVYVTGNWALGFASPQWQLKQGESFPVDFTFDGRQQFHVFGTALNPNMVSVPMPVNSALMERFRRAANVTALAKGSVLQFNLTDTSKVLPALQECVARIKSGTSMASTNLGKPVTLPATGGGSLNPAPAPAPTAGAPELELEAIQIASNFLIGSAMRSARVLARAETPVSYADSGAAWRSDDAYGFVRILPYQEGVKGIDVAASITASDAKDCKGKFASGRVSELVNSDVMFRGVSTCEDSKGTRVGQYFVVPATRAASSSSLSGQMAQLSSRRTSRPKHT
jgi:hypothetical protein